MTSDAHKAPRSHGDAREAVGTGIAYLSVSDAAQARVAAADAMDRVMANRKIGG